LTAVRLNLFWQFGLVFLALLLAVLLAVDIYAERVLRRNYLREGFERLDALGRLAQARPPLLASQLSSQQPPQESLQENGPSDLSSWVKWMARSGARITVVTADGRVLADSAEDRERWKTTLTGRKSSKRLRAAEGARSATAPRLAGIWSIWPCGISHPVAGQ